MIKYSLILVMLLVSSTVFARPNNGPYIGLRTGVDNLIIEQKGQADKEKNTVSVYAFAFGMRLQDVRLEVEAAMDSNADYGLYKYQQQRYSVQVYYDLPINMMLKPFINVGGGAMYTDFNPRSSGLEREDKTSLFWNAGAGLSVTVNRSLNVDIGYRYVDGGREKFYDWNKVWMRTHEGYIGMRYAF